MLFFIKCTKKVVKKSIYTDFLPLGRKDVCRGRIIWHCASLENSFRKEFWVQIPVPACLFLLKEKNPRKTNVKRNLYIYPYAHLFLALARKRCAGPVV